jgi:lipopolysaccharide transport system permease protein
MKKRINKTNSKNLVKHEKATIIGGEKKLQFIDVRELWEFRELLWSLVVRDIKVRYKQTIIGGLWAILQPFVTMVIFSIFFGLILKVPTNGVPYPVFSYSGLILWTYFTGSVASASGSLVASGSLITKVYFPKIIIPLAAAITGLIDYLISGIVLIFLLLYFNMVPPATIIFLPFIALLTTLLASGIGFWLSAINVKYRDVGYVIPFFIQSLLFLTPVIYPISISPRFRNILLMNPMTGIIEAHRSMIIGTTPIVWSSLLLSIFISIIIFISGAMYFKSVEKYFADII